MKQIMITEHFTVYEGSMEDYFVLPHTVKEARGSDQSVGSKQDAFTIAINLQQCVDTNNELFRILWPEAVIKGRHD